MLRHIQLRASRSPHNAWRSVRGSLLVGAITLLAGCGFGVGASVAAEPLALHPQNPQVFLFRGRPSVLIGSGEHYGAVVNTAFDFRQYLATVAADGLNQVRLFTGTYIERPGAFGIRDNVLAPTPEKMLLPWARSARPGASMGGNLLDLDSWDDAYFERLRAFVAEAGRHGIVVEVTLFSAHYGSWDQQPLAAGNNTAGLPSLDKAKAHTLDNGPLLARQEAVTRRIVRTLASFDNLYYEIQNEPWADASVTVDLTNPYAAADDLKQEWMFWKSRVDLATAESLAWQAHMAGVIANEEASLGVRHLVSQNYTNFRYPLKDVDPKVSILNFHYAWPEVVAMNRGLGRVVGFNETGFAGSADATYRRQAWEFIVAGGGLFSQLDYSFTVGHEDGRASHSAPGGGSAELRRSFGILSKEVHSLDLVAARNHDGVVLSAPGAFVRCFGVLGEDLLSYVRGDGRTRLTLDLPAGSWRAHWIDVKTGTRTEARADAKVRTPLVLDAPSYETDIALRLTRVH